MGVSLEIARLEPPLIPLRLNHFRIVSLRQFGHFKNHAVLACDLLTNPSEPVAPLSLAPRLSTRHVPTADVQM
jgi:hypothetical protein